MKREFILKKCNKCGACVEVLKDCTCDNCGIKCCGEIMSTVKENLIDCNKDKHLPKYKIVGNYVVVSVDHTMEQGHLIEYLAIDSKNLTAKKFLNVGEEPVAIFPYIKGSKILSYCNKHGLCSTIVQ